jgi:hypothetical protein
MRIKIALLTALYLASGSIGVAQSKTEAIAPNVIVKNLYAAHKAGSGPFFQTKGRAIVDEYFTKDLADLIWKDAVAANGEVGAIDFDPLYGSQDPQITAFTIMETGWGGDDKFGAADKAVVQVTFKNYGKDEMVSFQFQQGKDKNWKIYDIRYPNGEMLKNILSNTAGTSQAASEIRKVDFQNFDYGTLCAGEHKFLALEGKLVLSRGHQQQGDELNYADLGSVEYVDFDGDGKEEAFVVIKGQTAGSSNGYLAAYVFADRGGSAKQIWTQCEENSVAVLQGRSILFTRPEWVGDDAHCCFSYQTTDTYGWKGSEIALISTKRKMSEDERQAAHSHRWSIASDRS